MMKPFRLINVLEIETLKHHFSQVVQIWNDEYCITPLSINLSVPPKNYQATDCVAIQEKNCLLALLHEDYFQPISHALFGDNHPSFHAASNELFLQLINKLLRAEQSEMNHVEEKTPNWFYAGSTCLLLTLSCNKNQCSLILSPDWVYRQLPQGAAEKTKLDSLDDALAQQTISLNLELIPSKILVKNLAEIQVGDVLFTDHPLTSPLKLTREKQFLAQAELCKSSQHKSIVLTRSL